MGKLICVLASVLLLCSGCQTQPIKKESSRFNWNLPHLNQLVGHYVVTKHYFGRVHAMGAEEAKAWHGKALWVLDGHLKFEKKECLITELNAKIVDAEEYLYNGYRIDPKTLEINDEKLLVYETNCEEIYFGDFFTFGNDRVLITSAEGVFFKLMPAW